VPPITWESSAQEASCEEQLQAIKRSFLDARFYSIQGDSCTTARHAAAFLEHIESCRRSCPKGFLESRGYNDSIIKNVEYLKILGQERCLK
jgi:hypothetical protein